MEFTDYMIWKFIVLVICAAVYGFWRGLNGKGLGPDQPGKPPAEDRD
jgi:hypothetical protein